MTRLAASLASILPLDPERRTRVWLAVLVTAGLVVSVTLAVAWGGVRHGGDTGRYLDAARSLLAGEGLPGKTALHPGYVSLIAAFEASGLGELGVVGFQLLVAALSAVALFDLGRSLRGASTGLVAVALYVGYVDLSRWQVYLLTDSLFISSVVLVMWAAHRAVTRGGRWFVVAAVLVAVAATIRPNGLLLVPVVATYWCCRLAPSRSARRMAVASIIVGSALALTFAPPFRAGIEYESSARLLREGAVIWGDGSTWVDMPAATSPRDGAVGMITYGSEHPPATAGLAVRRVAAALAQVRSYYSPLHNAYIVLVIAPTYGFALWGWWVRRAVGLTWLAVGVVGVQLLFIGATFADYDGRFMAYVLPPIMLLAAAGATDGWTRWTWTERHGSLGDREQEEHA